MKTISVRDANQGFTRCIREVQAGEAFIITHRGTPVAKLLPFADRRVLTAEQEAALARTKARMEEGWSLGGAKFNRDELYQR